MWTLFVGILIYMMIRPGPTMLSNVDAARSASIFDRALRTNLAASLRSAENRASGSPHGLQRGQPVVIGYSTSGLPIESYTFGSGPRRVAFVGGIHGGAEWNTILLAYAAIDYFNRHAAAIPPAITVQIIPAANPDGERAVTGRWGRFQPQDVAQDTGGGRFNQNGVDLNRNWDCEWSATAWWGNLETSGGSAPFSERETQVLRRFFLGEALGMAPVQGVLFWHSAAPGVFAGGCEGVYPAAEGLATIYAQAAGYPNGASFSGYPITGDATNWLATEQIPAIVIELATLDQIEWPQNLAGILAALDYLAQRGDVGVAENEPMSTTTRSFSR